MLLNNMCEVLSGQLLDGRDRHIISTLEYAREYMMKRIVIVKQAIVKYVGPLTPTTTRLFQDIKDEASEYTCTFDGGHLYGVSGPWQDQQVIDVLHRTCTCRKWELTGMSCKHVMAVNWNMAANNMEGKIMWPKSAIPTTIIPPKFHPQIQRPPKKRKKSAGEHILVVKNGKLSRRSKTITCLLCKTKGHNRRSCTGPRSGECTKTKVVQGGSNKTKTAHGESIKTKTAHGGSKNKRPANGLSGRNVATMKTKTANSTKPTQASRLYFSYSEKKQGQCHCRFIPEIRNAS
ncbi:mutator type transposase [Tanacetum coccineum]